MPAMNGDTLGDAIKAAVEAVGTPSAANMTAIYRAIGGAIVDHIQGSDISTTGAITADGNITANADVPASSVTLQNHTHGGGAVPDGGT